MSNVTQLLAASADGDADARARLFAIVYDELRLIAAGRLANEAPGHSLDSTALVNEAYLRLGGPNAAVHWENRRHFFASAAEAMQRILIDHARGKRAAKRGGGLCVQLLEIAAISVSPDALLDLDGALTRFAVDEPQKAELVKLRFFTGLSTSEAAQVLGVSVATAERWWIFARTWLYAELSETEI